MARTTRQTESPSPSPTPAGPPDQIATHAMVVRLKVSAWWAVGYDREVSRTTTESHAAERTAGRFHKRLFGGQVPEHRAVTKAVARLRAAHHFQSLPWEDSGVRLLPTANYFAYTEAIRKARTVFESAVEKFLAAYPGLVETAAVRLGRMYRPSDYPTVEELREKFRVRLEYSPLPKGSDFRLELPADELAAIAQQTEERVGAVVKEAVADAWSRLEALVTRVAANCTGDGKGMRHNLVDKVQELAAVLERLNLTGDPALTAMRLRVKDELGKIPVETLKTSETLRTEVAAKAAKILADMRSVYGPAQ